MLITIVWLSRSPIGKWEPKPPACMCGGAEKKEPRTLLIQCARSDRRERSAKFIDPRGSRRCRVFAFLTRKINALVTDNEASHDSGCYQPRSSRRELRMRKRRDWRSPAAASSSFRVHWTFDSPFQSLSTSLEMQFSPRLEERVESSSAGLPTKESSRALRQSRRPTMCRDSRETEEHFARRSFSTHTSDAFSSLSRRCSLSERVSWVVFRVQTKWDLQKYFSIKNDFFVVAAEQKHWELYRSAQFSVILDRRVPSNVSL